MDKPIALVTGASRGIGRAVALQLALDGFAVVVHYHTRKDEAEATRDRIVGANGQAVVRSFDVGDADQVEAAVKEITRTEGPIQVLVNNAATIRDHLLMRMPRDAWRDVIETDLNGVYYCTKAVVVANAGRRRPGRRIINITSVAGETGNIGQANYAAAKAGVIGFTKAVARELAPVGVTVNAVSPGFIDTEAIKQLSLKDLEKGIPMKRVGRPEEVAHVVSFLASAEAAYITGQVIRVNGGLLM
ncbi:MAG: beta-ketoacyl-ACP reductase [Candidatus Rokubacteria bacterium RIFCSPLOWO2_12_FULL_71_22]|nr:MAG: beta-ketoacyl-ACP reductase [Candidatus Rokubacteria bacterium RIFCSPLOWO2_12_FULL_71_22]